MNNYAVGGNPLVTSATDDKGSIVIQKDLLGRTTSYTDSNGNITTTTYDNQGRFTSRTSSLGTESYTYDNYDRPVTYKLDGVTFATITYDTLSRISTVQYPSGISLEPAVRDPLNRIKKVTYKVGDTYVTDEITLSASGKVVSSVQNGVTNQYTYDKANRLTAATIGTNTFTYEYGNSDPACSGVSGNNINAGKNSNRTKMTQNGATTTYCYDFADRLISSSNPLFTDATYDSRGNTLSLGDASHLSEFGYDSSNRNQSIKETANGTVKEVEYERDSEGRILKRVNKINNEVESNNNYGYVDGTDAPSFVKDSNGNVVQKYISLPGAVTLTIKPQVSSAGAQTYSLTNIHGDVVATVNADGAITSTYQTGPFGEILGATPSNTVSGASWGYLGQYKKTGESEFLTGVTQMGARVYVPALGRFLQVDPVDGGTLNNYVYVQDPVNQQDIDGKAGILKALWTSAQNWIQILKPVVQKAGEYAKSIGNAVKNAAGSLFKPATTIVRSPTPQQVISRAPQQARPVVEEILKTGTSKYTPHTFKNYEGKLPNMNMSNLTQIQYKAHDLGPSISPKLRGVERVISGSDGSIWYTADHYKTFVRLK